MIHKDIKKNHSNKNRIVDNLKDQYYTKETVIEKCIIDAMPFIQQLQSCLDFSAGNNNFMKNMRLLCPWIETFYAYDIEPRNTSEIVKQDFLKLSPFKVDLIGFNPPFGYCSKLAKQFLEHASKFKPSFFLLILPHCAAYIYPEYYKEILSIPLNEDSFYIPTSMVTFRVKNCHFVMLQRDETFIYQKVKKEEIFFDDMKRLPISSTNVWWPEFCHGFGFAVRRKGVNAGKQILLWNGKDGIFVDHHKKEHIIHDFVNNKNEKVSAASFHAYVTDHPVNLSFIHNLWKELSLISHISENYIVPNLPIIELSECIKNVRMNKE